MNFNVGTFLTKRAQRNPDKAGVISEGRHFSFRELNARSNKWANTFTDLGLEIGERVGMLVTNRNEFLEAFFGLAKIGAVLVPLNVRLAPLELEHICKESRIKSLIFDTELKQVVQTMQPNLQLTHYVTVGSDALNWARDSNFIGQHDDSEPDPIGGEHDPVAILYTSGTTGHPKGVVREHANFLWLSMGLMASLDFPLERSLVIVPLCHGWGLNYVVTSVQRGATTVLMKTFNALHALRTIREERVEAFLAVPRMLQQMALVPDYETYLTTLRTLEIGQGLPPEPEKWLGHGIMLRRGYGLTEAGNVTSVSSPEAVKDPDSNGLPLICSELRISDENGVGLPPGEVGEILVKGPTVMKEYWSNPEATKEAIVDGWLHTGDIGKLSENGSLYVIDRKKDLIKSGGESIYPAEVEKILSLHPKILEVAVVGRVDVVWGEKVCAIIRPREEASVTLEDMVAFCNGKVARYKMPKELIVTKTPLPRDSSGKLLRKVLGERIKVDGKNASFLEGPTRSVNPTP